MDEEGAVVARQGYRDLWNGVEVFERTLGAEVKEYFDLRKRAESGDKAAQAEFFMRRFELGVLERADLEAALSRENFLSKDQADEVRDRLTELTVRDLLEAVEGKDVAEYGPTAKKLLELHRTSGLPEGPAGIEPWRVILEDAYRRKDAKTFKLAFTHMQAAGLRSKGFVEKRKRQLAELEKGSGQ